MEAGNRWRSIWLGQGEVEELRVSTVPALRVLIGCDLQKEDLVLTADSHEEGDPAARVLRARHEDTVFR